MINNRQAGRRRGRGGNPNGSGGGGNGPRQGGQGRSDNGNRIDNRARGNASQLYEKYKSLATEAQRQGDRVNTEYYHQFADHYFRVLSDQRGRFEEPQPRRQQNDYDGDGDEEFGDEGEPIRNGEQADAPRAERQDRQERPQRDGYRDQRDNRQQQDGRQNDGRQNDGRQVEGRQGEGRQNESRQNEGRQGEGRQNDNRQNGDNRQPDRPRRWERDERPVRAEAETEVAGQHRADPVAAGEDLAVRAETVIAADAPLEAAPRRRGRPRREPVAEVTSETPNAVESNGFEADRLPPSLGIAAANDSGADGDAPKPRRRRVRTATTGDVAAD